MWFIGVEVEQGTCAPSPKKILDPPLLLLATSKIMLRRHSYCLSWVSDFVIYM